MHMGRTGGIALAGAALGFIAGAVAASPVRKLAMQGLESTAGDWLDVLKAEHRVVEGLFEMLWETDDSDVKKRQALLTKIAYNLNKHAVQEENVVYPMLRRYDEEMAKHLVSDHGDIKTILAELQYELEKDDPTWLTRARALFATIQHHVREEEEQVYPAFRERMSEEDNASLTRRMHWEGIKIA